ncbi:MAG: hypothetical protein HRT71_13175 [Flavobacteriales bacterium]|nr:hypothetical protein [Flavobacteriales bacterium]
MDIFTALSKSQMARGYGINLKTFNRWLQPLYEAMGKPVGRLLNPLQVKHVIRTCGNMPFPERM